MTVVYAFRYNSVLQEVKHCYVFARNRKKILVIYIIYNVDVKKIITYNSAKKVGKRWYLLNFVLSLYNCRNAAAE